MYGKQISKFDSSLSRTQIKLIRRKIKDQDYVNKALENLAEDMTREIIAAREKHKN